MFLEGFQGRFIQEAAVGSKGIPGPRITFFRQAIHIFHRLLELGQREERLTAIKADGATRRKKGMEIINGLGDGGKAQALFFSRLITVSAIKIAVVGQDDRKVRQAISRVRPFLEKTRPENRFPCLRFSDGPKRSMRDQRIGPPCGWLSQMPPGG